MKGKPETFGPSFYAALRVARLKRNGVSNPEALIVAFTAARIAAIRS